MAKMADVHITDFGSNIVFEGGEGPVRIPRYGVWKRVEPRKDKHEVVEVGEDLEQLKIKYGVDDFRVIRIAKK